MPNGGILNITGCDVVFTQGCAGIVVDVGGRIEVSDVYFYPSDVFLWKGIVIQPSNLLMNFYDSYMYNADIGISLTAGGTPHLTARVNMGNFDFVNCKTGIRKIGFSSTSAQASTLNGVRFTLTSAANSLFSSPAIGMDLQSTDVFNITNCLFQGYASGPWTRGIVITGSGGRAVTIENCTFNRVEKGVYIENNPVIHAIRNSDFINIPTPAYTSSGGVITPVYGDTYGIMAVASKVRAEINTFSGVQRNMLNPRRAYGIVFDNTASGGSMAFANTFSGMDVGFQSQLNNIQAVVSCNNFNGFTPNPLQSNKRYSWITVGGGGAFMRNQGLSCAAHNTPAGNEWSAACTSSSHDVEIRVSPTMQNWLYFAHSLNTSGQPTTVPDCSTPAWKAANLTTCQNNTGGYQKQSTSCTQPFAYPPGFSKNEDAVFTPYDPAKPDDFFAACRQYADGLKPSLDNDASIQEEVVYYEGLMQWASNEVVTNLINQGKTADAVAWLEQSPLAEDAKTLCLLAVTTEQGSVQTGLDALAKRLDETVYPHVEYEQHYRADAAVFAQLMRLVHSANTEGRFPDKLSEEEIKELESLASVTSESGVVAEGFLELATGKQHFHEPILVEDDAESFKTEMAEQKEVFSLAPNPSEGEFTVTYLPSKNAVITELLVYDIAGKEVARVRLQASVSSHVVALKSLQKGIYVARIIQDGAPQHSSKLIIQ